MINRTVRLYLLALGLVLVLALTPALAAHGAASATSQATVPINNNDVVTLPGNVPPQARPEADFGPSDPSLSEDQIILLLRRSPAQETELEQFLAEQQEPSSPNYHRWLTPEQFGKRFGASEAAIAAVTAWMKSEGFHIDSVAKGRMWINVSGTVTDVERAFHTRIHDYMVDGVTYHSNDRDPAIPKALAGVLAGPVSLNNFPLKPIDAGFRPLGPVCQAGIQPEYSFNGSYYLAPADFATIYNVTPLYSAGITGKNVAVAIVGQANIAVGDINGFRGMFALPYNPPNIIVNSNPNSITDEGEAELDIEWSGAVAPDATIDYVESATSNNTDGILYSAQYIVDNNVAPIMSTSYYGCEASLGGWNDSWNILYQQAAAQGITAIAISGDNGVGGCFDQNRNSFAIGVSGLGSTPYNVCVGGSEFMDTNDPGEYWDSNGNAITYIPEEAWNESGTVSGGSSDWATGGGVSTIYSKPYWQVAPGVPADGMRDVPDVSLSAAVHDGYMEVEEGKVGYNGGTSFSGPAFAGIMALVVQKYGPQGNANIRLYHLGNGQYTQPPTGPTVFHDITQGNNSVPGMNGYSAGPGYDQCTGLGSVDAAALVNAWQQNCPAIGLNPSSLPAATVGSSYSATLSGSGGTAPYAYFVTGGLPPGLTLDPSAGTIMGTPTTQGTYSFSLSATDANGCSGSHAYTLGVVGGASSTWITYGPTGASARTLAIDPTNGNTLYVGTDNSFGIFKSTDSGVDWSQINNGIATSPIYGIIPVYSLAIDPQTSSTIYAGTGHDGYKSTDAGADWGPFSGPYLGEQINAMVVDPLNTSTIYAATDTEGAFKSTDGGSIWNPINTGYLSPGFELFCLAIDPQHSSTIYAGSLHDFYGIFKSTDGGNSWNVINNGITPDSEFLEYFVYSIAVNPQSPLTIYAATDMGVFESTDGGADWAAINNGLTPDASGRYYIYALAINPQVPSTLYAGGTQGVFESTNGGASWSAISNGLPSNVTVHCLAVAPQPPYTLYAGTDNGVYTTLQASPPSGLTISGTITLAGAGLGGVSVDAGSEASTTNNGGAYTLGGLANGTYTVTPSLSGYTFSPASQVVTLNGANVTGVDFTATSASTCTLTCSASAPANGQADAPITFQATAVPSAGCNGAAPTYFWDFGDGGTSSQQDPTHAYTAPGTYNWTVTVTAAGAATCSRTQSIVISSGGGTTIMDEFNGSTLGNATGITYAPALSGEGAVFDRIDSSRIEYSFNSGIPHEGTLEWWVNISSGYFYTNYQLYDHQDSAFLFGTDCNGGDVNYPGGAKLKVNADGSILFQMGNEYGQADYHNLSAASSPFSFNSWHSIGVSFGSQGNYLMVDGILVASDPSYTQSLQSAGNFASPVDVPTIGDAQSGFWAPGQYDGGFYGIVDRFRASTNQQDWVLSAAPPTSTCTLTCTASAPENAQVGSPISFQGSSVPSAGCSGSTPSYLWSFGDGTTSAQQNPIHTYSALGTYNWTMTATLPGASSCVQDGTIIVLSSIPVVTSIQKMGPPFRLVVQGSNLQSGIVTYINGNRWSNIAWKSLTKIVLKGGASLKAVVPQNTPVTFAFVNPDRGSVSVTWQWP